MITPTLVILVSRSLCGQVVPLVVVSLFRIQWILRISNGLFGGDLEGRLVFNLALGVAGSVARG